MDNLGSHKSNAVRDAIRKAGARLWLVPKSKEFQLEHGAASESIEEH